MTIRLPDELRQAIDSNPGRPVTIQDDTTQASYVVIPLELFEQWRRGEDAEHRDMYPLLDETFGGPDGWDAPGMEQYDDYDRYRSANP